MTDIMSWIETIRRPSLLLKAVMIGLPDYKRSFVLKRVASIHTSASASGALQALIPIEESLEIARKNGDASYVPSKHVEVLIAMIAEFRTFRQNLA